MKGENTIGENIPEVLAACPAATKHDKARSRKINYRHFMPVVKFKLYNNYLNLLT